MEQLEHTPSFLPLNLCERTGPPSKKKYKDQMPDTNVSKVLTAWLKAE